MEKYIGKKYNSLTILREVDKNKKGRVFICRCDCGIEKEFVGYEVKSGKYKTCGNHRGELVRKKLTKHTKDTKRLYNIHRDMLRRCNDETRDNYKNYGGLGITVCESWSGDNGLNTFTDWAVSNGYADSLTLDRLDVKGNYTPDNCRWVTIKEQNNNKKDTIYLTYNNKTQTLVDWCRELNLPYGSIYKRLYEHNYTVDRAFTHNVHTLAEFQERH